MVNRRRDDGELQHHGALAHVVGSYPGLSNQTWDDWRIALSEMRCIANGFGEEIDEKFAWFAPKAAG